MKRLILILAILSPFALSLSPFAFSQSLTGKRFYINPGHGSFGPNDRPMATIPFPNLPTTGMPDTCGFYESNTNLWKCLYLRDKLIANGATVLMSRTQCGPWPYTKVNGDYPDYTTEGYKKLSDYEQYNRALSEICEEVEANNIDYFISVHSNAASEGATTNYPLVIYRGPDDYASISDRPKQYVEGSYEKAAAIWPHRFAIMASGIDPASHYGMTNLNVRGDWSFYGSHSVATRTGGAQYDGYLGALKHGASGYLVEGYFHTYQPARHRALNPDYCHQEGLAYYRGILDYYQAPAETTGYIMGTVKDMYNKITNPLFGYAAKSNDQWIPCNGATVILKKAGVEVARYQVDTLYNGIFVFENLVPGTDYTLDATCPGYKDLGTEFKNAFEVKANETVYPMIFLVDTSYVPPTVVYENYPDPVQPSYAALAESYHMTTSYQSQALPDTLNNMTIRRVLYRDGELIVLALNAAKEPLLIEVDPATRQIINTLPTDFCSVSSEGVYKLSDIALTADGYLVGCNKEAIAFSPVHNWLIYKWEKNAAGWNGAMWINTSNNETAGNYLNAITGETLAYSGTTAEGTLVSTATTTGSTTNTRFVVYYISDNKYASALRNKPEDGGQALQVSVYGEMRLVVSPRDNSSFIISSDNMAPYEWKINTVTNTAPIFKGTLPFYTFGANYFKYAHHAVMAAPVFDASKATTSIALYDITAGLDKAAAISIVPGLVLDTVAARSFAFGAVDNMDITLYLTRGNTLSRMTTKGVQQPAVAHILAYDLSAEKNGNQFDFSFRANAQPASAKLYLYGEEVVADYDVTLAAGAQAGEYTFSLSKYEMPEEDELAWAIELHGAPVANVGLLHSKTQSAIIAGGTRWTSTVDNSPMSPNFCSIYLFNREGGNKLTAHANRNGLVRMAPDYTVLSTAVELGGQEFYGSPARISTDEAGYLYLADWGDPHSGIYVVDPANPSVHAPFFKGTQNTSTGVWTNATSVAIGSSSPGCHIYGTGANTKLIVYNEDAAGTLPANGVCVYQLGQEDSSIVRTWDTAPTRCYTLTGQANTEGNVWGTSHGFFVSQNRSTGNNNASATALKFYDWNGNEQLSSAVDPYKDVIDGCANSAYAVSADESRLVMTNGSTEFLVFDIAWEGDKPVLTLDYSYKHGIMAFRQMNFDFAGNLVCSGDNGFYVYSLPSATNVTTIPARERLILNQPGTGVADIHQAQPVRKFMHNGVICIERNGVIYDLRGQRIQ